MAHSASAFVLAVASSPSPWYPSHLSPFCVPAHGVAASDLGQGGVSGQKAPLFTCVK